MWVATKYSKVSVSQKSRTKKSNNFLKLDLNDFKFNAAKKSEAAERLDKKNDQNIRSYSITTSIWATNVEEKNTVIVRQRISLKNEKAKTEATEKCFFETPNKNIMSWPAKLHEILLLKSPASKNQK